MVAVNSTMQALGSAAPDFSLPNTNTNSKTNTNPDNELLNRESLAGTPLLVMFICNHCPFVVHIIERLVALANSAQENGFGVVAISSNDVENYPQDGPQPMRDFAHKTGMNFAYLFDESQSVAKAFGAACTPDFFIYDAEHRLKYRGQMDASRPANNVAVTGNDLHAALTAVKNGKPVNGDQAPSIGCNIKWKAGNEPDYF